MREIKKGVLVTRKSHGHDILFKVKKIIKLSNAKKLVILKGINIRIEADAPIEDLKIASKEEHNRCEKELQERINKSFIKEKTTSKNNRSKELVNTGRILHLDGDRKYSEKSSMYYKKMGLNAIVKNIPIQTTKSSK